MKNPLARLRQPSSDAALTWSNWAGNQTCTPRLIERPRSTLAVQKVVQRAAEDRRRVRVAASGHSFTAAACTDDVMISLEHLRHVRSIDRLNRTVTVDAGIPLSRLNEQLAAVGLGLTNLGDIAYQTIAGATSTGTHGTGLAFGGMATQIRGMQLVMANGEIVETSPFDNPALFHAARVGLGALGVITQLTLAVEPAFNLHAIERPAPIQEVLANWSESVTTHDHYEFMWIPGTELAMTKTNLRTQEPVDPLTRVTRLREKILFENVAFGAACEVGKRRPSLIPRITSLASAAPSSMEYTDESFKVFASHRWVKFVEMEYSVPLDDLPMIVERVDKEVRSAGIDVLFPIEARSAAGDEIPLSTATGRASGYIAVHMAKGRSPTRYFQLVEKIMDEHHGRPHWGKMHYQSAETLAPRYRQWDEFQRVRGSVDPMGMFRNDYTDRVLGPIA